MAQKVWTFMLDEISHTVRLEHGLISGNREIYVDGCLIEKGSKFFDTGSKHTFRIGAHNCFLQIGTMNGFMPRYTLTIDGQPATSSDIVIDEKTPVWAWLFALACFALIFLGGCIGGGIGGAGGVLCLSLSRNTSQSTMARVGLCALITGASWGLYLVVGGALYMALRGLGR